MQRILFVCTGNTCRSSMAEAIARHLLEKRGLTERVKVASAGTAAFPGAPATSEALYVMEEWGIDLTGHRAQTLTADLLAQADMVITMTEAHRQQVLSLLPTAPTFVLREYVSAKNAPDSVQDAAENWDLADPFGHPLDVYREVAQELKNAIQFVLDQRKDEYI